ncbi:MAG: KpsF/GutQ family sugar-phosphate isomerase [Bacteroidota bacterium]
MNGKKHEILDQAREAILQESTAIAVLASYINDEFAEIVDLCFRCPGRIVITGIGKSAIIAQKLVATFNSTGTPALYMHAADAIHGDLGMIQSEDVVICISKSGNSPEIKVLIPLIKNMGNKVIGMVGNLQGFLALESDHVLNTTVDRESCPNNLAPTTSTSAQMVMGDTLAVCLIHLREFGSQDFARYHPGGALGKKLYTKVSDLVDRANAPKVSAGSTLQDIILEISSKRLGATAVVDGEKLLGVITDGDLRRMLEKQTDIQGVAASDIMSRNPKSIAPEELAYAAFTKMENLKITQLVVTGKDGDYVGMIHLHDILKEGIF